MRFRCWRRYRATGFPKPRSRRWPAPRPTPLGGGNPLEPFPNLDRKSATPQRLLRRRSRAAAAGWHRWTRSGYSKRSAFRSSPLNPLLSVDEAVAAAHAIGYPVALKGTGPAILHKSDVGAVKLGIANDEAAQACLSGADDESRIEARWRRWFSRWRVRAWRCSSAGCRIPRSGR